MRKQVAARQEIPANTANWAIQKTLWSGSMEQFYFLEGPAHPDADSDTDKAASEEGIDSTDSDSEAALTDEENPAFPDEEPDKKDEKNPAGAQYCCFEFDLRPVSRRPLKLTSPL